MCSVLQLDNFRDMFNLPHYRAKFCLQEVGMLCKYSVHVHVHVHVQAFIMWHNGTGAHPLWQECYNSSLDYFLS